MQSLVTSWEREREREEEREGEREGVVGESWVSCSLSLSLSLSMLMLFLGFSLAHWSLRSLGGLQAGE
jgi:hypothetical protein